MTRKEAIRGAERQFSLLSLIYIGDHFYMESGTAMSPIYTEDGERSDWGFVQVALRDGAEVHIRQATEAERNAAEAVLARLRRARTKEQSNG